MTLFRVSDSIFKKISMTGILNYLLETFLCHEEIIPRRSDALVKRCLPEYLPCCVAVTTELSLNSMWGKLLKNRNFIVKRVIESYFRPEGKYVSFSKNFAGVLNESSLRSMMKAGVSCKLFISSKYKKTTFVKKKHRDKDFLSAISEL